MARKAMTFSEYLRNQPLCGGIAKVTKFFKTRRIKPTGSYYKTAQRNGFRLSVKKNSRGGVAVIAIYVPLEGEYTTAELQ